MKRIENGSLIPEPHVCPNCGWNMEHLDGVYQCSWCLYEECTIIEEFIGNPAVHNAVDLDSFLKLCLNEAKMGRVKKVEL